MTLSYIQKKQLILQQEEEIARQLAKKVVERPTFSFWMILIPVIFVFHLQFYRRWQAGVKLFIEAYIRDAKEILQCIEKDQISGGNAFPTPPSNVSLPIQETLQEYHEKLKSHYRKLVLADGDTYAELIRFAYPKEKDFNFFLQEKFELTSRIENAVDIKDPAQIAAQEKFQTILPLIQEAQLKGIYDRTK